MKKSIVLQLLIFAIITGCNSSDNSQFLYPSARAMEVRYLCRLPYLDAAAPHQSWSRSTPVLLIVGETKVIVYFKNDRTFVLDRTSEITLPAGKYHCPL
ncbi:MAG: hypothetical protein H8E38_03150 [SAR324 cluster bacterium]|nr:hypothetical protein [SAR324 cluster bacterium]MBL7035112.1 hypothetical protein [SAR324 cluster bacterium]